MYKKVSIKYTQWIQYIIYYRCIYLYYIQNLREILTFVLKIRNPRGLFIIFDMPSAVVVCNIDDYYIQCRTKHIGQYVKLKNGE